MPRDTTIDWNDASSFLVQRAEKEYDRLVIEYAKTEGEAPGALDSKLLELQAETNVQREVDDESEESQITDAMYEWDRS